MVYVLNKEGKPLMPTKRHGKVRRMLRDGLAVVIQRTPFTIRLTYDTTNYVQDVTLGVDPGSKHVGLSATTETEELYSSEVTLRTDIKELLESRNEARRTRRGHNTRYRAPRFDNRKCRKEGWLAPSVTNRIETHLNLIRKVRAILPVRHIVIETSQFDMQKILHPDIQGEQYQHGEQYGFWNLREYVLWRDNHECRCCHGKSKDPVLNVHHIESRKTGSDRPGNLVTLCETCHKAYHAGKIEAKFKPATRKLDGAAHVNTMRWKVYYRAKEEFKDVSQTYGFTTKHVRITNGLSKSERNDARCISGHPTAIPCTEHYEMRQTRRHNRQIHKAKILKGGLKKNNQAPYLVKGFRLFDKVLYEGQECFVFGRRTSGSFDIRRFDGTRIHAGISYKKLKFLAISRRYLLTQRRGIGAIPPPSEDGSILAQIS